VTLPEKLLCVLRGGCLVNSRYAGPIFMPRGVLQGHGSFVRKNFRLTPLQRGLGGKVAFYRHVSRKKVCLNRCSAAPDTKGDHHAGRYCRPHRHSCPRVPLHAARHKRPAIVDKNARIGRHVRIVNHDHVQEANQEDLGFVIRNGIVVVIKSATIPDGMVI
jgi:hypothetical protein